MITTTTNISKLEAIAQAYAGEIVGSTDAIVGVTALEDGTFQYEKCVKFRSVYISRDEAVALLEA